MMGEALDQILDQKACKITYLNLFGCGMIDKSAAKFIKFLKKSKQIKFNINHNGNISKTLIKELEQIAKDRTLLV